MLGLWYTNAAYTTESFSNYYKERKKYNNLLSNLLGYFIMDLIFKRIVYTVTEIEFHHNAYTNTIFIPESSIKMKIDPLVHTTFKFKYVYPQMHHHQWCVMCYRNGNQSATNYFCGICTVFSTNTRNRVPYKNAYCFPHKCMTKHYRKCVQYYYKSRNNHCIPSEAIRNITEPGDKTLIPCDFNDILIFESVRALPRVTKSNSRGSTNTGSSQICPFFLCTL